MALTPTPLGSAGTLTAVSPAGPVSREEVDAGIEVLGGLGYDVHPTPHALAVDGYLAGPDSERVSDLVSAFQDTESDGVICTRGGYGTLRLLPLLDWEIFSRHPKTFIGFSDITALQLALWQRCGMVTFSGPQLTRGFGRNLPDFSRDQWLRMVRGEAWNTNLPLPEGSVLTPVTPGRSEGTLLGGNLAVLAAMCGTKWAPDFSGSIVVLEEIDEPAYRIDRMLTQLLLSGVFENTSGILLGRFDQHVQGERLDQTQTAIHVLREAFPGTPLAAGAPYGHTGPIWTLPFGAWATLDVDQGTLRVEPPQ